MHVLPAAPRSRSPSSIDGELGIEENRQIGAYRLLERIGSGAMGNVYRAQHSLLGRMVAIKILRPELASDDAFVSRFFAEARAVNLIGHAHVIDVTHFERDENGTPWFVMELLEGCDLSAMRRQHAIGLRRAFEIVRQLCEALSAVHAAGIVHRDVKPENLFVSQRNGEDFLTLLDFGVARLPGPTSTGPLAALEGLVGTPPYMAPEQARSGDVDPRADLYAIGVVLFELVTGRLPLWHADMHVLLREIETVRPPVPSALVRVPAVIREELDALIGECLDKDCSRRPASAKAIAARVAVLAKRLERRPLGGPIKLAVAPRVGLAPAPTPFSLRTLAVRDRARRSRRASSAAPRLVWALAAGLALWLQPLSLGNNDSVPVATQLSPVTSSTLLPDATSTTGGEHRVVVEKAVEEVFEKVVDSRHQPWVTAPADAAFADRTLDDWAEGQARLAASSERAASRERARARVAVRAERAASAERAAQSAQPALFAASEAEPVVADRELRSLRSTAIVNELDRDVVLNPF